MQVAQASAQEEEAEHYESIVAEREEEIRAIENAARDVHEIFRDMAIIVREQDPMIGAVNSHSHLSSSLSLSLFSSSLVSSSCVSSSGSWSSPLLFLFLL